MKKINRRKIQKCALLFVSALLMACNLPKESDGQQENGNKRHVNGIARQVLIGMLGGQRNIPPVEADSLINMNDEPCANDSTEGQVEERKTE